MPRGPAPDRVPDKEAESLRRAWVKVRDTLGITNGAIADHIRCDTRVVTNAFTRGRALREYTAAQIAAALRAAALQIHGKLLDIPPYLTSKRFPPAIIPAPTAAMFAAYLADELAQTPGIGKRMRRALLNAIERIIRRSSKDMAKSFKFNFAVALTEEAGYDSNRARSTANRLFADLRKTHAIESGGNIFYPEKRFPGQPSSDDALFDLEKLAIQRSARSNR